MFSPKEPRSWAQQSISAIALVLGIPGLAASLYVISVELLMDSPDKGDLLVIGCVWSMIGPFEALAILCAGIAVAMSRGGSARSRWTSLAICVNAAGAVSWGLMIGLNAAASMSP